MNEQGDLIAKRLYLNGRLSNVHIVKYLDGQRRIVRSNIDGHVQDITPKKKARHEGIN